MKEPLVIPGSKQHVIYNLRNRLVRYIRGSRYYVEPFFGTGISCLYLVRAFKKTDFKLMINDLDVGVSSFWTCVIRYPDQLCEMVRNYNPTVESFYKFKEFLLGIESNCGFLSKQDLLTIGFTKLVLTRVSDGNLAEISKEPLGGAYQDKNLRIYSHWDKKYICEAIKYSSRIFNRKHEVIGRKCHNLNYEDCLLEDSFSYFDPPFYEFPFPLYRHEFNKEDHIKLRDILKDYNSKWVLTYNYHDDIVDLYKSFALVRDLNTSYKGLVYKELVIDRVF